MSTFADLVLSEYPEASTDGVEMLARRRRDVMLADCDWTQTVDDPTGQANEWAEYRNKLRNAPQQPDWPNVEVPLPPTHNTGE
jgi:hypothetical protein